MNASRIRAFHCIVAVTAFVCLLTLHPAVASDAFTVSTTGGFARLLFTLSPAGHVSAQIAGEVLVISFDRKVNIAPSAVAQALPGYVAGVRADSDGKAFRFALSQVVRVHTSASSDKTAVDLAPASYSGTPPDLPPPPPSAPKAVNISKLEPLKVRAGAYQNFTRVVFDWGRSVPYAVFAGAGRLTVRFEAQVSPDFSAITRQAPPWVKAAGWRIENKGTIIELETDAASGFHDFRDGTHIVVDVLAPKTDADAYNPPGTAKPSVTKLASATKNSAAVSSTQAQAIAATAANLNTSASASPKMVAPAAKSQQTAAAPAKTATPTSPPPRVTPPTTTQASSAPGTPPPVTPVSQPSAPDTQEADSKLIRDGVVLTFSGAGRRSWPSSSDCRWWSTRSSPERRMADMNSAAKASRITPDVPSENSAIFSLKDRSMSRYSRLRMR